MRRWFAPLLILVLSLPVFASTSTNFVPHHPGPATAVFGMPPSVFGVLFAALAICLYFLPCMVASYRHVVNMKGIVALDVLLGWTVIGWIRALLLAFRAETREQVQLREAALANLARATQLN